MGGGGLRKKVYRGVWHVVWSEQCPNQRRNITKRKSLHTKDADTAERLFTEYKRSLRQAKDTCADILSLWIDEHQHLKAINRAYSRAKPIKEFFGAYTESQIDRELCRKYTQKRRKAGLSNTSIRNELALLRAALRWKNPHTTAIFELPSPDPPRDHFLTQDEYGSLYGAARGHIKLFILLALTSGARSNAILELEWSQIDFQHRKINLSKGNHKNKRRAIIPIGDALFEALTQAQDIRTSDYVIEHGGKPIKSVKKGFAETCKRAGVEATPHVLRHTAAVVLAESGVPLREIGQFLGHVGTTTTDRIYALYSPDHLKGAAQALDIWHRTATKTVAPAFTLHKIA